jgi:hypothetical protein
VNGVLVCEEFLAASEAELLWRFAMEREPMFVASEVISGTDGGRRDDEFRRSRVLYELPGVHELLSQRVFEHLPLVFQRLGVAPFTVRHVELQATATNYLHEVAYVSCPSRRFEDSRLTYNGWLHR